MDIARRYSMHIHCYSTPTRVAPHPFDQCSADITLCTSDSVHFHVHSQILSQASPVFATMFRLPQVPVTPERQPHDYAISTVRPVVNIAEGSNVLEPLLRLCYPVRKPVLQNLDAFLPTLEAAIKYDMEGPTEELTVSLLACAAQGPLQVWAFGCRHGLEYVARRGAEALRTSLSDDERENIVFLPKIPQHLNVLNGISAGQYLRLLQFVRATDGPRGERESAAVSGASSASAVGTGSTTNSPTAATHTRGNSGEVALLEPPHKVATPAEPSVVANQRAFKNLPFARAEEYPDFSEDGPSPDILCRCEDGTEFKIHQTILSLCSPILRTQIATMNVARASARPPQPVEEEVFVTAPLLVLDLSGPSDAISTLLGICYQHLPQTTHIDRLTRQLSQEDCLDLLVVATQYKIQSAIDLASAQWVTLVHAHPRCCYFLACKRGMRGAAAVAATMVLQHRWRPETWHSFCLKKVENAPARTYHQLSIYTDTCSRKAVQVVKAATKNWELTAAERSTALGQSNVNAAARMYQVVTDKLNRQREALERRKIGPKADHSSILCWTLYMDMAGPPSLLRNVFKDDLESLSVILLRDIDDAISKVKLDLR